MNIYHIPVLLKEALYYLDVRPGKKYIDGTLGGGGHTHAILEEGGSVLGIDQDQDAIDYVWASERKAESEKRLVIKKGNFSKLEEIASGAGFEKVSGILLDLGVSSYQLNTPERGFSFNQAGPLDMRMDRNLSVKALDLVSAASIEELSHLLWRLGEESQARKIAKKIVEERKKNPIRTTEQLADIVVQVRHKTKGCRNHPATRTFQALRLAVNNELENLEAVLPAAKDLLEIGGRLVIISFHSLEDRIVKNYFKENSISLKILTDKPVGPSAYEVAENPRARSGKMRVALKIL